MKQWQRHRTQRKTGPSASSKPPKDLPPENEERHEIARSLRQHRELILNRITPSGETTPVARCFPKGAQSRALRFRGFRRLLVAQAHELMQGEGDLVGMYCAPGNDALEFDGIVSDGADFHQLRVYDVRVSHRASSMAHVGAI